MADEQGSGSTRASGAGKFKGKSRANRSLVDNYSAAGRSAALPNTYAMSFDTGAPLKRTASKASTRKRTGRKERETTLIRARRFKEAGADGAIIWRAHRLYTPQAVGAVIQGVGVLIELAQYNETGRRESPQVVKVTMNSPLEMLIYIGACGGSIATILGSVKLAHSHVMAIISKHNLTMLNVAEAERDRAKAELETQIIAELSQQFKTTGFTKEQLGTAAQAILFSNEIRVLPEAKKKTAVKSGKK